MFLENFVDEKSPAMLLKELGSLKMEGKEKVKFTADTKPHDSITID